MIASNDRYSVYRKPPPRLDDPFVQQIGAEIDQEPAEHEFRHEAEQHGAASSISDEIAATISPESRPVPPLLKLRMVRLNEMQPVKPPAAPDRMLARPVTFNSRSRSASRCRATSMPVVLNNVLAAVTKMTAMKSPQQVGQRHATDNGRFQSALHGSMKVDAAAAA